MQFYNQKQKTPQEIQVAKKIQQHHLGWYFQSLDRAVLLFPMFDGFSRVALEVASVAACK